MFGPLGHLFGPKMAKLSMILHKMELKVQEEPTKIIKSGLTCDTDVGRDLLIEFPLKRHFSGLVGLRFGLKTTEK